MAIDAHLDALKLAASRLENPAPARGYLPAIMKPLCSGEQFREIACLKEMAERPEDYREWRGGNKPPKFQEKVARTSR